MRDWREMFWIDGSPPPGLALVMRPRGDERLEEELARFKEAGIDTVVSMLEEDEADWLGLREEGFHAEKAGMSFLWFPIPDHHVPPVEAEFRKLIREITGRLAAGEFVAIHCQGTIGRATVTAACVLIESGWDAEEALAAIELARGCEVPDTDEQREWILGYEAGR